MNCPNCQKPFEQAKKSQRFCCYKCRVDYHNRKNVERIERAKNLERAELKEITGFML